MRRSLTRGALRELMAELARCAPRGQSCRVFFVGGGTAVYVGWRESTVDADLHGEPEELFDDIQGIKQRLQLNVEFARPEDLVPALAGSEDRHVFIETVSGVSFFHHDPYAQLLSKIVRGFRRDQQDADAFVSTGLVHPDRFRELVHRIPEASFSRYPAISQAAVLEAVDAFLSKLPGTTEA